jgi:hypothetical protein
MVVEQQEPPLMQIVVFSKARPSALEEHVTLTIIVNFYFILWPVMGHFSKNSLTKLSAIHEFSEFERKALFLIALSTSEIKKGEQIPKR